MDSSPTVLIYDPQAPPENHWQNDLARHYTVQNAANWDDALRRLKKQPVDVVLFGLHERVAAGLRKISQILKINAAARVIVFSEFSDLKTVVQSIRAGAMDYLLKPLAPKDLRYAVARVLKPVKWELMQNPLASGRFEEMIGSDTKMQCVYNLIQAVAPTDGTVLLLGESGTGKELAARALHNRSRRKREPFVVLNCAAIPAALMESQIFGHTKGAFTSAIQSAAGKIEAAHKGTLFLDDIDTLDVQMQAKLLRFLQEKEFERVGSSRVIRVDVRFIAASNRNLGDLIQRGEFREDLFFRLNVFPINLPPLRERRGDISGLLDHFLHQHAVQTGRPAKRFTPEAADMLTAYEWPGNVRELKNLVQRMVVLAEKNVIDVPDILRFNELPQPEKSDLPLREAVSRFERRYIRQVLVRVDGNRKKAAEKLGIHRNTLSSKISDD